MLIFAEESAGQVLQFRLDPLFEEYGIALAVMGILVVFAALVLVSLFITILPRITSGLTRLFPEEQPRPAKPKPRGPVDVSDEILVVLAAAAAEVIDQPHRIVRTRELSAEELAWSMEGRLKHHASHKTQSRDRW